MTHSKKRRLRTALAVAAVGAVVAGLATAFAAPATAADPNGINGYRNVGYFAQWGVYGRAYKLKQLETSGAAANLTHINYAFGNINNQTLKCFEANKAQTDGPTGSDGAGDAWADYGMGYSASDSVSGATDTWDQPLAGSFNQIKQLKAKHPNLKVLLSIGGWTWSKNYSAAAKTDASRKAFVSSCIDMFIKGNLPVIDGRGGAGSAAGVFDGIDIDWEWPGSNNGLDGNIVDTVNDKANFTLLLKEFRTQLDAYGATNGTHYLLSAFLPANPADIAAGGWNDPEKFTYLDYGNIQGYDLHGAWNPTLTGHQANLYDDPADTRPANQRFSADKAVKAYLDAGIPAKQLGLGLAAYGRGWQGVKSSAPWSAATGAAPGPFEAGNNDYDNLKTLGTGYYDAKVGAAWRYDGNQWWSLDTVDTAKQKAQYIIDKGLGGGMWWELDGDRQGELIGTLANAFRTGTPGPQPTTTPTASPSPTVTTSPSPSPTATTSPSPSPSPTSTTPPAGTCSASAWTAVATYTGGAKVSYNGSEYTAKWWTQGETPGVAQVWGVGVPCGGSGTGGGTGGSGTCPATWNVQAVYTGGQQVSLAGVTYTAQWWNQGDNPSASTSGAWKKTGTCS